VAVETLTETRPGEARAADQGAVTIVDYGVGNIASLVNMFDFIGVDCDVCADPRSVRRGAKLVLPGVGFFGHAMNVLRRTGLDEALNAAVANGGKVLGVCLGMQLLARGSEEGGDAGLGLIAGDVRRLSPSDPDLKVPNIGWREAHTVRPSPLFDGVEDGRFYHVHSYALQCDDPADVVAQIDYGGPVTVAVSHGHVHGVQFHPEKSHRFGMRVLGNFARM